MCAETFDVFVGYPPIPEGLRLVSRSLGDVANRKADREGALANYEKARSILQKLVEDDPRNGGWASLLSALQKTISRVQNARTETLSARE
jgi:Flp pilus assembly protein TadD